MSTGVRVLYVPNEQDDFRQIGLRRPLANLLEAGLIDDARVFSLKWRLQRATSREKERRALVELTAAYQPSHVIMQHLGRSGLRASHLRAMREAANFDLIYHEADPYLGPIHPLPAEAGIAGRFADVVFTVGSGAFRRAFLRRGARDVRWEPSPFDPERYEFPELSRAEREFDVVIVANRNAPRFRGLPNWRDRVRFVTLMQEHFGERLAVFGNGWTGPSARGPVAFSLQTQAIASAWISANWDHFADEPQYFSNRLPISLATGGIHAATDHPGYSELFHRALGDFLVTDRTPEGLVSAIEEKLRSTSTTDRYDASRRAREFAFAHFRQDDQLVRFLNFRAPVVPVDRARLAWRLDAPAIKEM